MINLPNELYRNIHEYLKLPFSITITHKNLKDTFINNSNLKIIIYDKENHKFIDDYKNDVYKLYLLAKKYYYYEYWYERVEPLRWILIDLLCTECDLPFALSSHSVFTDITFNDLKEIIHIAPESLKTEYGQLRCRDKLSPLDMACHNIYIPLKVIEYLLDNGANMYHLYEVNGYKTHVLDDINPNEASEYMCNRYKRLKQLFINKGFNKEKIIKFL